MAEAPSAAIRRRKSASRRPADRIRIVETRVLRGPNMWARVPVINMHVDLGELEDWPSNTIDGFNRALLELMPGLEDHACSLGRRGGFVARLEEGTWLGHVSEHVALALQELAGTETHIGKTRSTGERGHYNVIFEYREEQVGLARSVKNTASYKKAGQRCKRTYSSLGKTGLNCIATSAEVPRPVRSREPGKR